MTDIEKGAFLSLFNRGGYVLNFSTDDFNVFTMGSVGVALCEKYGLSKGKSLTKFVNDAPYEQVNKLLFDLLEYYELHYGDEVDGTAAGLYNKSETAAYHRYYQKCKLIAERERATTSVLVQKTGLEARFSSEYMHGQISALFESRESNPTEAIGKSKELIESCCICILDGSGVEFDKSWNVSQLVKATMKTLDIAADDINEEQPAGKTVRQILGGLAGIAGGIAELRNTYGSGHGKGDDYHGLSARHAKLAVGASTSLVEYLWDAYEWRQAQDAKGN